jgi:hypothetical protein
MSLLAIYTPRLPTYAEWLKMSDEQRLQWRYDFSVAPARATAALGKAVLASAAAVAFIFVGLFLGASI